MKFLFVLFISLYSQFSAAQGFKKTLEKYSKAKALQFNIIKTDEKTILGTKSESKGILKYQKGHVYLVQEGDKKIEIFYSDKVLTLVEHPDVDFDPKGGSKVTILKKANSPLMKSLLSLFSDSRNFLKSFTIVSEKKENNFLWLDLKPKTLNIKKLSLKFDTKTNELVELSFVDEVETRTTIEFVIAKMNPKFNKNEFKYIVKNTDEVVTQ